MATKEAAVGGAVLAGGGAGGGYAAYHYLSPSDEEEKPSTDESATAPSTTKTIQQQLEETGSDDKGKPIAGKNDESDWWKKADHRYYLEVKDDGEKIDGVGGQNLRNDKYKNTPDTLKNECKKLTDANYLNADDANFKKAKKWCTTYKTVKGALGDGKKDKNLKGDTDSGWTGKYDEAKKEADLNTVLEGIKKEFESETDNTKKEQKTIHRWCEIALDASEEYQFKEKVSSICVFEGAR